MHYLISFPRSGSNYVQNVVRRSSGLGASPFNRNNVGDPTPHVLFKSHAVSMAVLRRYVCKLEPLRPGPPGHLQPRKIVLLIRDPRDVMISYFEYATVRTGRRTGQREFLVGPPPEWTRDVGTEDLGPIRVVDAFRLFVRSWHGARGDHVLRVRFEELVADPAAGFQRLFDFLGLDCAPDPQALVERVSQVSAVPRPRARAGGWRSNRARYAELLDTVAGELAHELRVLGYGG